MHSSGHPVRHRHGGPRGIPAAGSGPAGRREPAFPVAGDHAAQFREPRRRLIMLFSFSFAMDGDETIKTHYQMPAADHVVAVESPGRAPAEPWMAGRGPPTLGRSRWPCAGHGWPAKCSAPWMALRRAQRSARSRRGSSSGLPAGHGRPANGRRHGWRSGASVKRPARGGPLLFRDGTARARTLGKRLPFLLAMDGQPVYPAPWMALRCFFNSESAGKCPRISTSVALDQHAHIT